MVKASRVSYIGLSYHMSQLILLIFEKPCFLSARFSPSLKLCLFFLSLFQLPYHYLRKFASCCTFTREAKDTLMHPKRQPNCNTTRMIWLHLPQLASVGCGRLLHGTKKYLKFCISWQKATDGNRSFYSCDRQWVTENAALRCFFLTGSLVDLEISYEWVAFSGTKYLLLRVRSL